MYIKDMQDKLNAEKESLEKQKDNLRKSPNGRAGSAKGFLSRFYKCRAGRA